MITPANDPRANLIPLVLADLESMTYDQVATKYSVSRGWIYGHAVENRCRKNETRIRERANERQRRREEFLKEAINATKTADVLDFLDGLPDNSVQMHVTSIPYNLGKKYGGSDHVDQQRFHYFLGWLLQVLSEMERTLAPGGVMFLQAGSTRDQRGELYPLDCLLLEHLKAMGLTFNSRVIWTIPHGLTPTERLSERHETALVMSKGAPAHFNPTPARVPSKQPGKRAFKGPNKGQISSHPLGAWPSNVWADISNVGNNHPDKKLGDGHPAQFPEKLARRAILLWSVPQDLICDPFMGTGTTAAAALKTGRAFTGCDLFYSDTRAARLANLAPDLVSILPGVTDESLAVWQAEARPVHVPAADAADQHKFDLEMAA